MEENNLQDNKQTKSITIKDWPGAFGAFKLSKEAILVNLWSIVALWAIYFVVDIVLSSIGSRGSGLQSVMTLVIYLVGLVYTTSLYLYYFKSIDGQKAELTDVIKESFNYIFNVFVNFILIFILSAVSLLAFVVPFFFVMPRVILAPYFVIDKKMGPIEALQASWSQTKGNVGKVYGIIGVNILIALLMFTIIGIPFAIYFFVLYQAAFALLYKHITSQA